ncbi:hypothetical protein PENTCL1PPCAC_21144, partial [Pristionchus entomophagus]
FQKYWPHALILGTEIPTLFLILTSVERICAVCWPAIFREIFSELRRLCLIVCCVVIACVSLAAAAASAYENRSINDSGNCMIIQSTARWYSTFHFVFIIIGYGVSLVSLLVMKIYCMKCLASGKQALRRDSKSNILIAFAATSLMLVSAPSVVMIGLRY